MNLNSQKILILLPNDNLGGAEQFLKMIAEYFSDSPYNIDVYFLKKRISGGWDKLENEKIRLHFTKSKTEKSGAINLFWKLLLNRDKKYDYVFTSHIHLNSFVDILRRLKVINCNWHVARESTSIYARYTGIKLFKFNLYYRLCYTKIDLLICQTDFMQQQLKKGAPNLSEKLKIIVLENPINLKALKKSQTEEVIDYSNFIVSAGRLIPEKGFDILIETFHKLHQIHSDLNLIILGEGAMRKELESKINELELNGHVHMPGFVNNVYSFFKQALLCVVSSRIEGFPNVLLQMMSQNEKVVSTLCAGGIDQLKGVATCSTENPEALFETILTTIDQETSINRILFNDELENRSIDNFMKKIILHLECDE